MQAKNPPASTKNEIAKDKKPAWFLLTFDWVCVGAWPIQKKEQGYLIVCNFFNNF